MKLAIKVFLFDSVSDAQEELKKFIEMIGWKRVLKITQSESRCYDPNTTNENFGLGDDLWNLTYTIIYGEK